MAKAIEIELLRVSANGQNIEFIINCPYDYKFTTFEIEVVSKKETFSIAETLFYDDQNNYITEGNDPQTRFLGTVPISSLGVNTPEIYKIHIEADHNASIHTNTETPSESSLYPCGVPETITHTSYISDVSNVYECLAKDIDKLGSKCIDNDILDKVIRNYLILYAHQEAMNLDYIDEAEHWFNLTKNCFNSCKSNNCGEPCNCGCKS